MRRRAVWVLVAVLALMWALPTSAEMNVSPFAKIFAYYQYNISGYPDWDARYEMNDYNSFEIWRIWTGLNLKTDYGVSGNFVIDAYKREAFQALEVETDDDGNITNVALATVGQGRYLVYVRNAMLQYKAHDLFGVRFGLIPGNWAMDATKAWAYRFVAVSPVDGTAHYEASNDFGIGFFGTLPSKLFHYYFTVMNGEGFAAAEVNEGKAFNLTLGTAPFQSSDLLKGLTFNLYGRYDIDDPNEKLTRTIAGLMINWKANFSDDMNLNFGLLGGYHMDTLSDDMEAFSDALDNAYDTGYSYENGVQGYLASVWAIFTFYKGIGVFARYDMFNPNMRDDTSTADDYADDTGAYDANLTTLTGAYDEVSKLIAGVSYKYHNVLVSADYQTTMYTTQVMDDGGDWTNKPADSYFYVHSQIAF